ncbi:unnamed protein product [Agarophyton chilense]|eukprot:gb/GEZJ01001286.1/.p1 GENE.gb/GEZJ01001286.1/~~gb/GEZJ01001286.1/.p1  ORF type:complete len:932 (-),score=206.71 gb/GEZJ01001286.1/:1520-4315(-)
MLPRLSAPPFLAALLVVTLLSSCKASLMAVDLGLAYTKVAVARPGKGLELVTNEQSKRKTPSAVAFTTEGERLFGDAAIAYAAKAPARAVLDGRAVIGQCTPQSHPGPFCERSRYTVDGVADFTGEEIMAMLLSMSRRQASTALGGAPVKDVAVTVPSWFDQRQRMAIADAARVAGLNCLGVVNSNTAAAIKYALDGKAKPSEEAIAAAKQKDKKKRTPKTITQTVMFYDLGASGASASIAQFTSDVSSGSVSRVKMLSHAWEHGVGGRLLDSVVIERLADAFDEQRGAGATPARDIPRVMMRLRKEAQKVREVLSANTETFVSVASLHDDVDLRTTVSRADFEADAAPMFKLVGAPAKAALHKAGLSSADLDAVVPFGGASRTPKVQVEICNALGISSLNKSINTDEAAVMGAVFFAASLSSTFRVRKLDFEDLFDRPISAEIEKESKSGIFSGSGKPAVQRVELFPAGAAKMPSKKTLSLNKKTDFGLQLFLDLDSSGVSRFPERTLYANIKVKNVADVLKKLKDSSKAKSTTPRVALTFHVDRSGIIRVGTAESSVDETVVVEREVIIEDEKTPKNKSEEKQEQTAESSSGSKATETASGEEESYSPEAEQKSESDGSKDDSEDKTKKTKKKKTKTEKSTQTIVHRLPLTVEYVEGEGVHGMQMSGKQLEAAKKVLKNLEDADNERVERADALNALEGYILEIRSKVRSSEEDDDLYKVSTEEERDQIVSAFDEAEDWMYTDDAKQTANLRKKHHELQRMYSPLETRAVELAKRPQALRMLSSATDMSLEQIVSLREIHVQRNSDKVAEFDDVIEFTHSVKAWVTETESQQAGKSLTEEPVVTVRQIMEKGMSLKTRVENTLKMQPPQLPETPAAETDEGVTAEAEANSTASGTSDVDEDEIVVGPGPNVESAKAGAASGAGGGKDEL